MDTKPQDTNVKSKEENISPHLQIYDHLPKDVNILSNTKSYQQWARTVLPRIDASRGNSRPGFAVKPVHINDEFHRRQVKSEQDMRNPPALNLTPDTLQFRKQAKSSQTFTGYQREASFLPNRKKVKPGLVIGSVYKNKVYKTEDTKLSRSYTSPGDADPPVLSSLDSTISLEYGSGFTFQQAYDAMANKTGMAVTSPAYRGSVIKHKPSGLPPRQKTYVSIALPALPKDVLKSPSFVSSHYAYVPYQPRRLGDIPTDAHKRRLNPRSHIILTSLSTGMAGKRKTIPSLHDTAHDIKPHVSAMKA